MSRKEWLTTVAVVLLGGGLFGVGFWLGMKIQTPGVTSKSVSVATVIDKKVEALAVPGVVWIKAGEEPKCPSTHPIKGRFDTYTGYYYMPDYKTYDKIKPVVCFATEDFAAKTAGFLKKY